MQVTISLHPRVLDELMLLTNAPTAQLAIEIAVGEKLHRERMTALLDAFPHMEHLSGDPDEEAFTSPTLSPILYPWE